MIVGTPRYIPPGNGSLGCYTVDADEILLPTRRRVLRAAPGTSSSMTCAGEAAP